MRETYGSDKEVPPPEGEHAHRHPVMTTGDPTDDIDQQADHQPHRCQCSDDQEQENMGGNGADSPEVPARANGQLVPRPVTLVMRRASQRRHPGMPRPVTLVMRRASQRRHPARTHDEGALDRASRRRTPPGASGAVLGLNVAGRGTRRYCPGGSRDALIALRWRACASAAVGLPLRPAGSTAKPESRRTVLRAIPQSSLSDPQFGLGHGLGRIGTKSPLSSVRRSSLSTSCISASE